MKANQLEQLYMEKRDLLKNYLIKNGCPSSDAEDIVQNTFVKAIQYEVILTQKNVSAWLFKVALHSFYDICRKNNRYPTYLIGEDSEWLSSLLYTEETGEVQILQQEATEKFQSILNTLTAKQRNLLLLHYDLGISYEEMAQMLDTNVQNIKTSLYRARLGFKKKWEELHHGS